MLSQPGSSSCAGRTGRPESNFVRVKRVCVFTGASGRLGTDFIKRYRQDYDIVAVYHSRVPEGISQERWMVDPLDPEADIPENHDAVFAVSADLVSDSEIRRVAELALARFGRVDLLVNGAVAFARQPIVGSGRLAGDFDHQFRLNVRAPLILSVTLADMFWRSRTSENVKLNRHIVNVASIGGVRFYPGNGLSVYSASKAALVQLSRHMASEFAEFGIRVNVLAPSRFPGLIPTSQVSACLRELDQGQDKSRVVLIDGHGRITG